MESKDGEMWDSRPIKANPPRAAETPMPPPDPSSHKGPTIHAPLERGPRPHHDPSRPSTRARIMMPGATPLFSWIATSYPRRPFHGHHQRVAATRRDIACSGVIGQEISLNGIKLHYCCRCARADWHGHLSADEAQRPCPCRTSQSSMGLRDDDETSGQTVVKKLVDIGRGIRAKPS
jgi:hypothetical protein